MHESICDPTLLEYRAGLCEPYVRPNNITYLWVLYAITLVAYFTLAFISRNDENLKTAIWKDTPELVKNIELGIGIAAWAVLGTYLGLAEAYDPVTLVLFFISQIAYMGAILLSARKKKDMSLEILAALVMSAFFMLVHLFFTGTYAVLAIVVFQNTLVNDLVLYSLGRYNLLEVN